MNKTPSILVDTGFEVDQNGALDEIVIPKVVSTLNAPRKVTFEGQTLNYIPSTAAALQEFEAPNLKALSMSLKSYTALTKVSFPEAETISFTNSGNNAALLPASIIGELYFPKCTSISELYTASSTQQQNSGTFQGLTQVTSLNFPELIGIEGTVASNVQAQLLCGTFSGMTGCISINMPKLRTIEVLYRNWNSDYRSGVFCNMTSLVNVSLPSINVLSGGRHFASCTAIENVTLGSEGNPVTSIVANTFVNCTQPMTITIYTTDGAALSGSPWGATNATIVYEEA